MSTLPHCQPPRKELLVLTDPEREAMVYTLVAEHKFTFKKVANLMGCSPPTASRRYFAHVTRLAEQEAREKRAEARRLREQRLADAPLTPAELQEHILKADLAFAQTTLRQAAYIHHFLTAATAKSD
jgi:hypothetical protein